MADTMTYVRSDEQEVDGNATNGGFSQAFAATWPACLRRDWQCGCIWLVGGRCCSAQGQGQPEGGGGVSYGFDTDIWFRLRVGDSRQSAAPADGWLKSMEVSAAAVEVEVAM